MDFFSSVKLCRYLKLKENNFNNIPDDFNEQDNPLGI